ncbi:MAG: hypothetical protein ACSHYF_10240 [Verrucomicrobiaceae bacterium]
MITRLYATTLLLALSMCQGFAQKGGGGLGGGGSYDIDPGGINVIANQISDGNTPGNLTWLIDLGASGSDYHQNQTMTLTGSTLTLNIESTPLLSSYTIAYGVTGGSNGFDSAGGGPMGQFASVTGLPVGYSVVYVENQVRVQNMSVPEVSSVLPMLGVFAPWFWSRRRRNR